MTSGDVMSDQMAHGPSIEDEARRRVTVSGGAPCGVDAAESQEALRLGRLLVEAGFDVCSGGYAG